MPCLPVTLKALKPKETDFEPRTLGEHVRKRRLECGLSQRAAADRLGVSCLTVLNWEKGKTEPLVEVIPSIIAFIGYYPFPQPINPSDRLLAVRRVKGWSTKEAAKKLGVDEGTWSAWEAGRRISYGKHRHRVERFLMKEGV